MALLITRSHAPIQHSEGYEGVVDHVPAGRTIPLYAQPQRSGAESEDTGLPEGARRAGDEGCLLDLPEDALSVEGGTGERTGEAQLPRPEEYGSEGTEETAHPSSRSSVHREGAGSTPPPREEEARSPVAGGRPRTLRIVRGPRHRRSHGTGSSLLAQETLLLCPHRSTPRKASVQAEETAPRAQAWHGARQYRPLHRRHEAVRPHRNRCREEVRLRGSVHEPLFHFCCRLLEEAHGGRSIPHRRAPDRQRIGVRQTLRERLHHARPRTFPHVSTLPQDEPLHRALQPDHLRGLHGDQPCAAAG